MSGFLDFISNLIPITGNSLIDTILFFAIGAVAFFVAWGLTSLVAPVTGYDSEGMSGFHWIIRVIVFVGLMLLCIGIAQLVKWFFSLEWWVYLIIGLSLLHIIAGIIVLRVAHNKKRKAQSDKGA